MEKVTVCGALQEVRELPVKEIAGLGATVTVFVIESAHVLKLILSLTL